MVTCLSSNGHLLASGGVDGRVCLWQWGRDEFLHQVGQIYMTNLPILTISFDTDEIIVSIDTYIMNLKVTKRTSQLYILEQQPQHHIRMQGMEKVKNTFSIRSLNSSAFLVLRSSNLVEVMSGSHKSLLLDDRPSGLCINHQGTQSHAYTMVALTADEEKDPIVYIWSKEC